MRPQRIRLILLSICVGLCLFLVLERNFLPGRSQRLNHRGFDLLENVTHLIRNDYLEERDPARTMEGAYKGLVDSLDPVSSYFSPEITAKYLLRDSRWAEIGVILFKGSYGLFPQVAGISENSPAEKAGVKIGDYISAMDGRETMSMSSLEADLYLKDLEQKPVDIKLLRDNQTLELKIAREVLYADAFRFSQGDAFATLTVNHLYPPFTDDLGKKLLPSLKALKKPLVLDLRNCHEGDIEEACRLLGFFVNTSRIGYLEKKNGEKTQLAYKPEPDLIKLPSAVWINGATMGAAELVAAVLQETGKVKVVGTGTPGLVSSQDLVSLQDDSSVLLTSGVFTLASGKKLWGEGVTPDEKTGAEGPNTEAYAAKTAALLSIR